MTSYCRFVVPAGRFGVTQARVMCLWPPLRCPCILVRICCTGRETLNVWIISCLSVYISIRRAVTGHPESDFNGLWTLGLSWGGQPHYTKAAASGPRHSPHYVNPKPQAAASGPRQTYHTMRARVCLMSAHVCPHSDTFTRTQASLLLWGVGGHVEL